MANPALSEYEQKKQRTGRVTPDAMKGVTNLPTPAPVGTNGTPGTGTAAGIPTNQKPDTDVSRMPPAITNEDLTRLYSKPDVRPQITTRPAHGPGSLLPGPGLQYTAAPATRNANAGLTLMDVNNQIAPGAPLPFGAGRSASGAVIPDVRGRSTIAMGQILNNPVTTMPAPNPVAVNSPTPIVSPTGQSPTAIVNPPAVSSRAVMDAGTGPVATLPGRVVKLPDGTTQINPQNDSLGAQMVRQGMGETGGGVPGGNVSVFQMSPEQQAEVVKRKAEGSAALTSYDNALTRANITEGARGPREVRRAAGLIASMDAAAGKTAHAAAQASLETEKAKADIFSKTAQAYKDLGLVDKSLPFDRQKAAEKYMGITKDPVLANTMTEWEERKHAGTGVDVSKKLEVYDADFNKIPIHIYGVADKKHEKAANDIIQNVISAQKQYADSGFLGIGKGKAAYQQSMNVWTEQLRKMGIILMPDSEQFSKS